MLVSNLAGRAKRLPGRIISAGLLLMTLLAGMATQPCWAKNAVDHNDFQNWDMAVVTLPITDRLSLNTLDLLFIGDNWQHKTNMFLQPDLTFKLTKHLSYTQGYAWTPAYNPSRPKFFNENRVWEQLQYDFPVYHDFKACVRQRLEERFIGGVHDTALRSRTMIRVTHPIPFVKDKRYYLAASNELWVHLNTVSPAIKAGINQDWAYVGVGKQITPQLKLEAGYMFNPIFRRRGYDTKNHAIMFTLNYTLLPKPLSHYFHQDSNKTAEASSPVTQKEVTNVASVTTESNPEAVQADILHPVESPVHLNPTSPVPDNLPKEGEPTALLSNTEPGNAGLGEPVSVMSLLSPKQ